ncbi:MAG: hypothetical protein WBM46_21320 [Polyangiales bacterium]|jgi:hypothetical protein
MLGTFPKHAACIALIFALVTTASARASVVIALDLQELTSKADRIVVGRVVWTEPVRTGHGMIRTRYRFAVEQDLRGSGDAEVLVETLGGTIGRLAMHVDGSPSFALGERVVMFLRDGGEAIFQPVGVAQGVMRVERENGIEMVVPSRRGTLLLRPEAKGALVESTGPLPESEPLDVFLSRVRAIIDAERGEAP